VSVTSNRTSIDDSTWCVDEAHRNAIAGGVDQRAGAGINHGSTAIKLDPLMAIVAANCS
jgi:hypothetical protein